VSKNQIKSKFSVYKNSRAFSLIEIVVVAGLLALFASMVFRVFTTTGSNRAKVTNDLQMQTRALNTQNRIIRMIREGRDFVLPDLGEESAALFFIDTENNIQVLYQLKDNDLSDRFGKTMYKLMHYKLPVKDFDISNPVVIPGMSSTITEYIKSITFRPSNANAVNITACFATENREFQTMFEVGLMNTGDSE